MPKSLIVILVDRLSETCHLRSYRISVHCDQRIALILKTTLHQDGDPYYDRVLILGSSFQDRRCKDHNSRSVS
jgi:hypothetical protein